MWLKFGLCAGIILYSGAQLSRHGDVIADKTGLSKNWIGLVLLATITSLPELITGVSAVTLKDLPDMAVSGTIGSCMFNMMIIALLDVISKSRPVSNMVHQGHMISAGFGIVLLGVVAADILMAKLLPSLKLTNSLAISSLVIVPIYLLAMRIIYSYEKQRVEEFVGEVAAAESDGPSLRRSVTFFAINSLIIVTAACYLPEIGEQIAKATGWGESFIGSSFIAITTSLPEITVSVVAARLGSFDMAVANLLGSNLFNIFILAVLDLCYHKDALLHSVSLINAIPAIISMISMGIVVIGLTFRSERKILFIAGDAAAIFIMCLIGNILLFIAH